MRATAKPKKRKQRDLIDAGRENMMAGIDRYIRKQVNVWAWTIAPGTAQIVRRQDVAEWLYMGAVEEVYQHMDNWDWSSHRAKFLTYIVRRVQLGMQRAARELGRGGNSWSRKDGLPRPGMIATSLHFAGQDGDTYEPPQSEPPKSTSEDVVSRRKFWRSICGVLRRAGMGREYLLLVRVYRDNWDIRELARSRGESTRAVRRQIRDALAMLSESDCVYQLAKLHDMAPCGIDT